jgi:hypothetical protein
VVGEVVIDADAGHLAFAPCAAWGT